MTSRILSRITGGEAPELTEGEPAAAGRVLLRLDVEGVYGASHLPEEGSMKHLDILHDPSRSGDAVADARARLDTTAFRAVAAAAARFAAAGIGRGDVVATVLTNRVELVVALYAADLGAVLTPINPALTPDEIAYQLTDGGVRLAVVEAATAGKVTVDSIDAARCSSRATRTGYGEPRRPTTWPCSSTRAARRAGPRA